MKCKGFLLVASVILILMGIAVGGIIVVNTFSSPPLAEGAKLFIPGCGGNLRSGIAEGMHLGEGKPGDTLQGHFELRNAGSEALTFHLKIGCACASINPADGVVKPGGSEKISVAIRLRKKGQNENTSIWITTNDPNMETATYPVSAKCPRGFFLDPPLLDFGNVRQGTGNAKTARILSANPGGDLGELKETVSSNLKITRTIRDARTIELKIELPASLPVGPFFGLINVKGSDGEEQSITVSASICKSLIASPSSFFLPTNIEKGDLPKFSCLARRFDGKSLGKLGKVVGPSWLKVSDASLKEEAQYRLIELRILEKVPASMSNSPIAVALFFQDIDEPLEVSFSFLDKVKSLQKEDEP